MVIGATTTWAHHEPGTSATAWQEHPRWRHLPSIDLDAIDRVVVVAAHPDDESLGAAGLCGVAHARGVPVELVLVTTGQHSHPDSPTTTPDQLGRIRRRESTAALAVVSPGSGTTHLGIQDGEVAAAERFLTDTLVRVLRDARSTLLVAPWRHDGHPDHEAAGRAAAAAAIRTGAHLLEYPIWFWHWGEPSSCDWDRLRRLELPRGVVARKHAAIACHATQVAPLSDAPGDEALLDRSFLAHFNSEREVFVAQPAGDTALDVLHREEADPWGVDSRWYEERKRALTCAVLPRARFGSGLELGCSTGTLAAALADRCDTLVAVDSSPSAVATARARLAPRTRVSVEQLDLPSQWPDGTFDLVVVSELGYFLSPADLELLVDRAAGSLAVGGVLVLCHWRHPVVGWPLGGPAVHEMFRLRLGIPESGHYEDGDVEISLFCAPTSMPAPTA